MYQPIGTPPLCVEVTITAENAEWLTDVAHALVDERLAACGRAVAPVRAIYHRGGELRDEPQARVDLHTRATLVAEIVDRVTDDRPDGGADVVATQLVDGDPDYLQWVVHETRDGADHSVARSGRGPRRRSRVPGPGAEGVRS